MNKLILLIMIFLVSCAPQEDSPTPAVTTGPVPPHIVPSTSSATPVIPPPPTPTTKPSPEPSPGMDLLPHSLYFLDVNQAPRQVWRMETNGSTITQVTNEAAGVEAFSVSPVDGTLAFTSENRLFLVDGSGQNRRLVADDSILPKDKKGTYEFGSIGSPVFSPDGRTLAYGFGGLHIYNLDTGTDQILIENMGNLLGTPFVFSKELYSPVSWSPDGSMLLFSMAYFEGSTLGIYEPRAEQPLRRLWSGGPVDGTFTWTADSQAVLVANPNFSTTAPGLWSYDARSGVETRILGGMREDRLMDFVGYPFRLPSGDLLFFYLQVERFNPEMGIPLKLVQSSPDGSQITQLRPEEFHGSALWAPDGSMAVISGRCCGKDGRSLVLARRDGSPLQVLVEEAEGIINVKWGP